MRKLVGLLAAAVFLHAFALGYPGGVAGTTTKTGSMGCANCHGSSPTLSVVAVISGPSTLNLVPWDALQRGQMEVHNGEDSSSLNDAVMLIARGRTSRYVPEGMAFVEGGSFDMGSEDGEKEEKPLHRVFVESFYIDTAEVTVAAYRRFCKATGRPMPQDPMWGWNDADPIVNVSWSDADAFARWAGKRLPTEAEWEYAARGGAKGEGYLYAGSRTNGEVAWCWDNAAGRVHPVGTKKANILGIRDMSGNVWEWCADWHDAGYYQASPAENPKGPSTGEYRVVRGGSWNSSDKFCRVTVRGQFHPNSKLSSCGFRCAKDLE